jgi:tetratricopeptide (TPR) repeat protein
MANRRSLAALVNLGAIAARQDAFDVAEQYLRMALEVEPRDALARQYMGRIAMHRGRPLETVQTFEEILADTPDHLPTIIALGWLRAASPVDEIRNPEQATALADRALSLAGRESVEALDLLAATQAAAGKFDEAVATMVELSKHTEGTPKELLEQMQRRVDLYARHRPYLSPPVPDPAAKPAETSGEPKPAWAK